MEFKEPAHGLTCRFEMIHRSLLVNSPFQRAQATTLVNKLSASIYNGFIVPLIVVEEAGVYLYIDGQHRLAALDKIVSTNDFYVPCIVVPKHFKERPLIYNIEKSDNIRDISTKVYNLYMFFAESDPEMKEIDLAAPVNFMSYAISIAFAYVELGLKSPSLVEDLCSQVDKKKFFQDPLKDAIVFRRNYAVLIQRLENVVNETVETYGIKDFHLKEAIISKTKQKIWGSRAKIEMPFEQAIEQVIDGIQESDWSWMGGR